LPDEEAINEKVLFARKEGNEYLSTEKYIADLKSYTKKEAESLILSQKDWLKQRNTSTNIEKIKILYATRIVKLQNKYYEFYSEENSRGYKNFKM
jgi:hypothetical protein